MSPTLYAIGDVHGRLDLLDQALALIPDHADGAPYRVIMLGDYVDRGPESAGVLDRLRAAEGEALTCLKGNHEAMMVKAVRTGAMGHWMRNGGGETIASFGGEVSDIPADLIDWLDGLPVRLQIGKRLFVHGGIDPEVGLAEQDDHTCMWIRDRFLAAKRYAAPLHVVHGHTTRWKGKPTLALPERLRQRTNLDTCAYYTGVLSIGVFKGASGPAADVLTVIGAPGPAKDGEDEDETTDKASAA